MPGFNICGSGEGPSSTLEVRRVHRWIFETIDDIPRNALLVLKEANRPKYSKEQVQMHHNQEEVHLAGKTKWEPINLTWYDVEQDPDVSEEIYNWLQTVGDITEANVEPPQAYKKQAQLSMLDGAGSSTESWTLCNVWPADVDWGGLDYSTSDLAVIKVTMRFDRAQRG